MPIDTLKIDQSFVAHVQGVDDEAPIIEAIIGLARSLHLNVVAEGVESAEQVRFLAARGCTEMQGFLFSPPLPADEIEHLLLLSDATTIDWIGMTDLDARFDARPMTRLMRETNASRLLSAICSGDDEVGGEREELEAILAALLPPDATSASPSTLRTASRIAAGAFIGIVPVTTGLAAAHALPAPIQEAVAAAYGTAGVQLPHDARQPTSDEHDDGTLMADQQSFPTPKAMTVGVHDAYDIAAHHDSPGANAGERAEDTSFGYASHETTTTTSTDDTLPATTVTTALAHGNSAEAPGHNKVDGTPPRHAYGTTKHAPPTTTPPTTTTTIDTTTTTTTPSPPLKGTSGTDAGRKSKHPRK
jgi:hypothetical protein